MDEGSRRVVAAPDDARAAAVPSDAPATAAPSEARAAGTTGYRGFLFCDLRGWTRFVEHHGDRLAADLLDRYRILVRDAVSRYEGAEIRTEGDSFFVVFPSASRAVLCALAIVEGAREAEREDPSLPIRVAAGVHAGEAIEHAEGFVGQAVNIAARVCAQAQAGEVLVTDTVRSLTRTAIVVRFDARGRRQLKGIDEPVFLFAAIGPGAAPRRMPVVSRLRSRQRGAITLVAVGGLALVAALAAAGLRGFGGSGGAPAGSSSPSTGRGNASGLIAFTDARTATAWVIGADGSGRERLETSGVVASAQLSADGAWLVYATTEPGGGPGHIEVLALRDGDQTGPMVASHDPGFDDRSPAWSPDRLAIAFSRSEGAGGARGLWVMNFDGSQPVQVSAPASEHHDLPAWSPDGTRIAFTVAGSGTAVISPECAGFRLLGGASGDDQGPAWSPDGSRIAFTGALDDGSATDVFVMDGAGRNVVNLTADPGSDRDPAWSPDGARIAFVSNRSGEDEIWIAASDGSAAEQLTRETGHAFTRLSWSLVPPEPPAAPTAPPGQGPAEGSLLPPVVGRPVPEACPARMP